MNRAMATAAACALACTVGARAATLAHTDAVGRIRGLDLHGDPVGVSTDIRVPLEGWKRVPRLGMPGLASARDVHATAIEGGRRWTGRIMIEPKKFYRYEQTLREAGGAVRLALRVTAEADVKTAGVFFWLTVPIALFGGGTCALHGDGPEPQTCQLPTERRAKRKFLWGTARRLALAAPDGGPRLEATFDPPCGLAVQDNRVWRSATYSALVRLPGTPLAKGQAASLAVTLKLTGPSDTSPARLALDPTRTRYRLDGFGGNYCFAIESPVTQYTLDNLRVAWARIEMTPAEWEPENDNASPSQTNWNYLKAHDLPESNLRRELLLAQQLSKRGIPCSIAVWRLPEWLYTDPGKGPRAFGRRIAAGKWPEVLECLGSYLLYAKEEYGVEPGLFSFNEPDGGVRVKFTPEEHRDAVKRLGAHFEKLGLKTRMLLGDVCHPRGSHKYVLPAAADPEAMRHAGAVAFHSWGGATPAQYAAWADLADKLRLPLLVTELGVDARAWRGRAFDSFLYALREVRMYQELILRCRPRATMQWEFTGDYATVKVADGKLVPTARFWFVKHFCNLTPPNADVLGTSSDNPKVLLTAFRGKGPVYTLHIANLGAERQATLEGLPAAVGTLRAVRTSETDSFRPLPPVKAEGGVVRLRLARQSLLTLTTMPAKPRATGTR